MQLKDLSLNDTILCTAFEGEKYILVVHEVLAKTLVGPAIRSHNWRYLNGGERQTSDGLFIKVRDISKTTQTP